MPQRNWRAIGRIEDYHLRIAVSLATGRTLARFQKGFPHLFMKGRDAGPLCVPLSVLMEAAEWYSREYVGWEDPQPQIDRHFRLEYALKKLKYYNGIDIPYALSWGDGDEPPPPKCVTDQLLGQKARAGMVVSYEGHQYVVVAIEFESDTWPEIGEEITEKNKATELTLLDATFVALDK